MDDRKKKHGRPWYRLVNICVSHHNTLYKVYLDIALPPAMKVPVVVVMEEAMMAVDVGKLVDPVVVEIVVAKA